MMKYICFSNIIYLHEMRVPYPPPPPPRSWNIPLKNKIYFCNPPLCQPLLNLLHMQKNPLEMQKKSFD